MGMDKALKYIQSILIVLLAWGQIIAPAQAQNQVVAQVYLVEGSVSIKQTSSSQWLPVTPNQSLSIGDTVRTGDDGKAAFKFVDGALVRLGRLSALTFNEVMANGSPQVTHSKGRAFFFSRGARKEPRITTPLVNAAIYGTELILDVSESQTTINVLHGAIKVSNAHEDASVSAGESVTARKGEPLTKSIIVNPADTVQWMIRFPFVLTSQDVAPASDSSCSDRCVTDIQRAIQRTLQGASLHAEIEKLPSALRVAPRAIILEAIALWRSGDDPAARHMIESLPHHLAARDEALRHILLGFSDLLRQQLPTAQAHLAAAEQLKPGLANTELFHSYILQAQGDINAAIRVSTEAQTNHPQVPDLLDRSSELLLSADRYEEATRIIATRLKQFGPSAMSSTLAGFAALANKEYTEADSLFAKAIQEDASQSLAYLGGALIRAHSRDYGAAQDKLSQAVQLDPSVAVYRSYLGKLYFEDENSPKAIQEFNAAIALDPNDPTPYLYRSFARIAENDPIGGLRDVENSITRNDDRAVYRSSLLLDRDIGVRSAGLARTFTDLGFDEAARIEAIKSITDDYTNFSAHRLLSDSYQSISDVDARLSEQRIADLMAPLSFNLFNSLGETASLSDYNALFDKKETRKAVGSAWNSNHDQVGGSLLAVGKGDDYGYLMSYQPNYEYGSHKGTYYERNILRGALQYETSPADRVVLDTTFLTNQYNGPEEGDYSEDVHIGNARLGYNHRFSTNLKFLSQGEFARDSEHTNEYVEQSVGVVPSPDSPPPLDSSLGQTVNALLNQYAHQRVERGSLSNQLIYSSHYLDSVTGVDGIYADTSRREESPVLEMTDIPPPTSFESSSAGNLKSGEVYEYLSLKAPRTATLTLGGAATHLERDLREVPPFLDGSDTTNKFNPKVGLVLTPNSWATGRFAYFESTNKTVLEDLSSLEPTLVGGINQRFNDLSGTQSRNLGFGLDIKDPNFIYAGAQYTRRNITNSYGDVMDYVAYDGETTSVLQPVSYGFTESHANADILRSYIYTILTSQSVLTADALYERFSETDEEILTDPNFNTALSTQRYRFGYRYFIGKHFSVLSQATYRDQELNQTDDPYGFWLFDLGANYRFSEQHGRFFARVDNILDRNFTYDQFRGIEPEVLQGRSFIVGINYNFF